MKALTLAIEAVVVGVALAVFAIPVSWVYEYASKGKVDKYFPDHFWPMEASLFTTGVLVHLFFEFTGLNKMYAQYKVRE